MELTPKSLDQESRFRCVANKKGWPKPYINTVYSIHDIIGREITTHTGVYGVCVRL